MDSYTKNGLLLILIGLLFAAISTLLSGLFFYMIPIENTSNFIGYILSASFGGIGGLISLIGAILLIAGRKEFGEKHQKYIIYALVIFIAGMIISGVIVGIGIFFTISDYMTEASAISNTNLAPVVFISTVVGAITGGLTYVFALYELENKKGRYVLYAAFILSVVIAIIIGVFSMGLIDELYSDILTDPSSMDFSSSFTFSSNISEYSIFGAISSVLWIIAVYIPYKRIKDGDLVPKKVEEYNPSSPPSERICPNCKKDIPTDANICPYCGKHFETYY